MNLARKAFRKAVSGWKNISMREMKEVEEKTELSTPMKITPILSLPIPATVSMEAEEAGKKKWK